MCTKGPWPGKEDGKHHHSVTEENSVETSDNSEEYQICTCNGGRHIPMMFYHPDLADVKGVHRHPEEELALRGE